MIAHVVDFFISLQWVFFAYFIGINTAYLGLHYISIFSIIRYMRDHRAEYLPLNLSSYQPPISILIPAHNEEQSICSSIHSLLRLDYPEFEIVVVNDGSTDSTREVLIREFAMFQFPEAYRQRMPTEPVRAVYVSSRYPQVRLVDKEKGGKSDALNAGINCVRYPLYCALDADCIMQPDSLVRVARPFLEDATTVASGGVVRVLNGCTVKDGFLEKIELPRKFLPMFQNVEYLRAFLFGRMGWSPLNALLIVSGAFGLFYKERVIAVGGYRRDTVGEDMDLVVRLHRQLREEGRRYRITFVPDPICWTEVPGDLRSLRGQRIRWQRGLAESLAPNFRLMFGRRRGAVGWLAFPFMVLFEMFGPLIEVLGYVGMLVLWSMNLIPLQTFLVFLFLSIGMGLMLSTNAILLEELSFQMYPRIGQQLRLFAFALLENLGFRQLIGFWRLVGLVKWLFTRGSTRHWGEMTRDGSWQHPAALPVDAAAAHAALPDATTAAEAPKPLPKPVATT